MEDGRKRLVRKGGGDVRVERYASSSAEKYFEAVLVLLSVFSLWCSIKEGFQYSRT